MGAPHTPEPWQAIEWNCHAPTTIVAPFDPAEPTVLDGFRQVIHYGHQVVANCEGSLRKGGDEANAARIVACVNACKGIDFPDQVIPAMRADIASSLEVVRRLKSQSDYWDQRCDRLFGALSALVDACHKGAGVEAAVVAAEKTLAGKS